LLRDAVEISKSNEDLGERLCLSALRALYEPLSGLPPSEELAETSFQIHTLLQKLEGDLASSTVSWLNTAGYHWYQVGLAARGLECCERALGLIEKSGNPDGVLQLVIALNTARCLLALDRVDAAHELLSTHQGRMAAEQSLPKGLKGCVLTELGIAHRRRKEGDLAREVLAAALRHLEQDLDSNDAKIVRARRELAELTK